MFRPKGCRSVDFGGGLRRREFLRAGAIPLLSNLAGLKAQAAITHASDVRCIFLMLVGGPSQLDTWDPKPGAPAEIRGPYRPIKTNVPGIEISEIFPRMARHADKYALIRSMHHEAAPVHDTGHQLMQTGRLFPDGVEYPHVGCVAAKCNVPQSGVPAHVLLPGPIGKTGGNMPHGQGAGFLGKDFDPVLPGSRSNLRSEPAAIREKYGLNRFGQSCLQAARLVEAGVPFVTVNMFETVFNQITWDIHGSPPFSPMSCYRDLVGPMFDMAYSALLADLSERGLLASTMVLATGEFGRTPKINPAGGRDHWPQCWTMLMAGGGVQGGQVIGSSDAAASAPRDRPVTPAEIVATIYHRIGIDPGIEFEDGRGGAIPLLEPGAKPVMELFG